MLDIEKRRGGDQGTWVSVATSPHWTWCPWIYRLMNQGEGWGASSVLWVRNKGCIACGEFQTIIKLTKVSLLFIITLNNVRDKILLLPLLSFVGVSSKQLIQTNKQTEKSLSIAFKSAHFITYL